MLLCEWLEDKYIWFLQIIPWPLGYWIDLWGNWSEATNIMITWKCSKSNEKRNNRENRGSSNKYKNDIWLPHCPVFKGEQSMTKIRPVFNCSLKQNVLLCWTGLFILALISWKTCWNCCYCSILISTCC